MRSSLLNILFENTTINTQIQITTILSQTKHINNKSH